MATKVNDADINELAGAIAKALKTSGIGGGSKTPTGGSGGSNIAGAGEKVNLFELALEGAGKGVDKFKTAYDKLSGELENGLGTWRDLSKSGVSFNNDIIAMTAASAGARVGLGEFSQTIKENQVNLAGFGGGVGEGAKAFASLSKKMFDAGEATDSLRQLGYTNKELNDILALQAGMIGSSMRKGAEKDAIAIKSAQDLAYEMDMIAKLTGKSREAQMESQKKLAADAAYQAKLDQATRGMDETKAAEYRAKMGAEYAKAEAMGLGQVFKETFTYGQVMSKQAATEQQIALKAGTETARAAQAAAAGNFEESTRRLSVAQDESIKNNKDANFQNMAIYGQFMGAVGEGAQKQYMSNKAITDTVKAIEKEEAFRGKSTEEIKAEAVRRVENEQKNASASTKAVVNVEQRMNDLSSVMNNAVIKPLNDRVNPELNKFADNILGARSALIKGAPEKGVARAAEDAIEEGARKRGEGTVERPKGILQGVGYGREVAGEVLDTAGKGVNAVANRVGETIQRRQGGSLEMAGKLFENWGQGTLVELHGLESVMRPEDMKKIMNASMGGMGEAMKNMQQPMSQMKMPEIKLPSLPMPDMSVNSQVDTITRKILGTGSIMSKDAAMMEAMKKPDLMSGGGIGGGMNNMLGGLNLSDLSKNISTSFSSVFGGAAKTVQIPQADLAELTKPFSDSFAGFTSKLKSFATSSKEKIVNEPFDEWKGIDEAIAKQLPFDEFAGLDEAIAKQMPFDEFAGLDEFIAKQLPFDEFAGLDEAIAKQLPFDEFAGLDDAIAKQMAIDTEFGDLEGAMAKVALDVHDEFGDLAGAMKAATERMYPDTEFGDLEGAMAKVATDVDTEFGDLAGAMKRAAEDMAPDTEFGDLEGAMARVSQDIDTEFGDLDGAMKYAQSQPYDEFGGLDAAIAAQQQPVDEFGDLDGAIARNSMDDMLKSTSPTTAQQPGRGKIDINSFTLSKSGMPIAKPKSTTAAAPSKPAEKQASPGKAINQETGEEYTPVDAATASAPGSSPAANSAASGGAGGSGKSTLDDVVKALTSLNTKVGQLVSTSEQGFAQVARSNKSMSNNLYERAKA